MNVLKKHDLLYMITKMGYIYLFDMHSGKATYRARISTDTILVTSDHSSTGGVLGITRKGQVLMVALNEAGLVPYVISTLRDTQLALEVSVVFDDSRRVFI
jgi:clathrin heavy chain